MPVLTTLILGGAAVSAWQLVKTSRARKKTRFLQAEEHLVPVEPLIRQKQAMSLPETEAAQQQYVALSALSLFGIGALSFPMIAFLGLPLLAYNLFYYLGSLKKTYLKKKNPAVLIFEGSSIALTLYAGWFLLTAFLLLVFYATQRLIAKTERDAEIDFSRIFGELSGSAWLLIDESEVETPLEHIQVGDTIVVHAGEMIPVDGQVIVGQGLVDQHLLTGESQPVEKQSGDAVLTSTLVLSGALTLTVEKQGEETITGQIAQTLQHAATFQHQAQSRGDRIVEKGASRTMLACAAAWPIMGMGHAVALSYSGFGYQMRMAAPLMVLNYLRVASRTGILIKDGRALDTLSTVDTIVFDKTGTLTEAIPQVERMVACSGITEQQLLRCAASAEQHQKHPIAQAIGHQAKAQALSLWPLAHNEYVIGHGLRATLIDPEQTGLSQTVLIGSQSFIKTAGIVLPESIAALQSEANQKGHTVVYIASAEDEDNRQLMGVIELRPTVRRQAREVVTALQRLGMTLYIISGDQEAPTRYLAKTLGVDHYYAETLPNDKANRIQQLQAEGRQVCFIGDGINDAVALQRADVSISLQGAATIAQDTADIVLMTPDLWHVPYLVNVSRELQQRMTRSEWLNNASGMTCVSAILFLGMGVGGAIALYCGGVLANITNAMWPLLTHVKQPEDKT